MRKAKILVPLTLGLLLTACGPVEFLNSCFSEANLVVDPELAGTWKDQEGDTTMRFRQAGPKGYEMLVTEGHDDGDEPERTRHQAQLAQLGGCLFLDLLPEVTQAKPGSYAFARAESGDDAEFQPRWAEVGDGLYASLAPAQQAEESREGSAYEIHLSQAHRLYRVQLDGDTLQLTDLNDEWLKAALDSGRFDLDHQIVGDSLVVTASTEEVERLLMEVAGEQGAFPQDATTELHRQQ